MKLIIFLKISLLVPFLIHTFHSAAKGAHIQKPTTPRSGNKLKKDHLESKHHFTSSEKESLSSAKPHTEKNAGYVNPKSDGEFVGIINDGKTNGQVLEWMHEIDDVFSNQISGSGSGYGAGTKTANEKLKGFIEEESMGSVEEKALPNVGPTAKKNYASPETDPQKKLIKLATPAAKTATEKAVTKSGKVYSTIASTQLMKTSTGRSTDKIKSRKNPLLTSTQQPATITTTATTTSFLVILQGIRQDLDVVLKWREEHERRLSNLAKLIGEAFRMKSVSEETAQVGLQHERTRRSNFEKEGGLSFEIRKKIEENFPCRHPKTMTLIKSGTSFFKKQDCLQCQCYMGRFTCEKDLKKCFPNSCHLLDREIVPNLAIHNDGCNNCLCYFGELLCTRLRCPEADYRYTNYEETGLENSEPENLSKYAVSGIPGRGVDGCLECDHVPGPEVCGKKQWKTFPSLCHAMSCGANQDKEISGHSCETLEPCASSPCGKDEQCILHYKTPCLVGEKSTKLCRQYECVSRHLNCSSLPSSEVCGNDGKTYSSECEMTSKNVQMAYRGSCKKNCVSEVCGVESRTYATRCHANEMNAHVDYAGPCEYHFESALIRENSLGESSFRDERCDLVYEHRRCAPAKCDEAVLPPGACCPVCGSALLISLNLKNADQIKPPLRLGQVHIFITSLHEMLPQLCKTSIDLTYAMNVLVVIQPYKIKYLEACNNVAAEIVDKINFERSQEDKGIITVLGAATIVRAKASTESWTAVPGNIS